MSQTPNYTNYTIPAYAALKSPTQEVQEAEVVPPTMPPTSLRQAQVNFLLDKLQEEAAEVIQAVNKIRRFGENSKHPERATTNKQDFANELEDFLAILAALEYCKYLDLVPHQQNILHKTHKLVI
jgi:NTP pyrophosphatase (non-canonical NTP hydrolase)